MAGALMAENRGQTTINIERRISASIMLAIWLAVFVLPVALLQLSLDYLFKLTRQANMRAVTVRMTNEMNRFRNDLEIESYLQRTCEEFFLASASRQIENPLALAACLRTKTGISAAGVMTHTADTQTVDFWFSEELNALANMSRTLGRRWFVSVNEQQLYHFYSTAAKAAVDAIFRFSNPVKAKKDADLFFRRMFSLIAEIPVVPGRVSRSLSAKLGGPVFFYYHPFREMRAGFTYIDGGCLLIIRGRDIPWHQAARAAANRGAPGLQRNFSRFSQSLWEQQTAVQTPITRFFETEQGYHLQSTMSRGSMIDFVQDGTLVPARLQEFARTMPLLQVSVSESQLQHPLFQYRSSISFICRLFLLAGTMLLMNLYLFGFDFKAGITSKVVAGTAFILVLPFILLASGFISWNQINQVSGRYRLELQQHQLFTDFTEGLADYMLDLQRSTCDLAQEIEENLDCGQDEKLRAIFARHLRQNPVTAELRLDRKFSEGLYISSPFLPDSINKGEESSMRLFAATIMHGFDDAGVLSNVSSTGEEESFTSMNASFINKVVNRCGGVYKFAAFGSDKRFSSVYFNFPGKNSISGILTAVFDRDTLLANFVRKHIMGETAMRQRFFIMREDSGLPRFYDLADNREVSDARLLEQLKLASISGHNLYETPADGLTQIFSMIDMSLFMMVQGKGVVGERVKAGYLLLLPLYGLLLMLLILLVFKLIYLRPIEEFIRVTESVAAGDYQQRVDLNGADEFGELKVAFDEMVAGLEQRRCLSHFLSSEAMRAVEDDSDESMAPGGVRIEASIAFVKLHDLHGKARTPESVFKALGSFIDAADRSAMRHGGVVDKLVEDTLMLVFRSSVNSKDHAFSSVSAILDLVVSMRKRGFQLQGAIASGSVVSGRIGSRLGKLDFTVIGDTVNLAARLKAEAHRTTQTGIIVAPSTIRLLRGRARVSFIARTEIKGKSREYPLYELTALRQPCAYSP